MGFHWAFLLSTKMAKLMPAGFVNIFVVFFFLGTVGLSVDYVQSNENNVCIKASYRDICFGTGAWGKPNTETSKEWNWKCTSSSTTSCGSCNNCVNENLIQSMTDWSFAENSVLVNTFPIDPERRNFVRRHLKGCLFSAVKPTPLQTPIKLAALSYSVLQGILDLHPIVANTPEFLAYASGNDILRSSFPVAHRYGGHQFGYWADQLGDGRAHMLGEYANAAGERWEIQLKGSGKTPYSRDGDGRAVIRSSVREYLASEAMHYLGAYKIRAPQLLS